MKITLIIPANRVEEISTRLWEWKRKVHDLRESNPCFNYHQTYWWNCYTTETSTGAQLITVSGHRTAIAADGLRDILKEFPLAESRFAHETSEPRLTPWETLAEAMGRTEDVN